MPKVMKLTQRDSYTYPKHRTKSSAVAERLCGALCHWMFR